MRPPAVSLVPDEYYAIGMGIDSAAPMPGKRVMSIARKGIVLNDPPVAQCNPYFSIADPDIIMRKYVAY